MAYKHALLMKHTDETSKGITTLTSTVASGSGRNIQNMYDEKSAESSLISCAGNMPANMSPLKVLNTG